MVKKIRRENERGLYYGLGKPEFVKPVRGDGDRDE